MTREQINQRLLKAGYTPSPSQRMWTDPNGKLWLWMNAAFNVCGQDLTIDCLEEEKASHGTSGARAGQATPA